jgi:hypothetical protein
MPKAANRRWLVDGNSELKSMSDTARETLAQIKEALYAGRKIEAIKVYREVRCVGLKEAKEDVDKLERELRKHSPEKFTVPPAKGCLGAAALLGAASSVFLIWLGYLAVR